MRNRKDFYKNLATKLTSKTIKKCLGLLLILVLLVSNFGYAPNVYSSSKGSISKTQPKLSPSLKTDGRTSVSSLLNKVNILGNSTNTEKYSKSENIYSGLENPSILNGQNLFSNQNDNNPNVVSSIYGSGPATPNELKIGDLVG